MKSIYIRTLLMMCVFPIASVSWAHEINDSFTSWVGGSFSSHEEESICEDGEVVFGIRLFHGDYVNRVRSLCGVVNVLGIVEHRYENITVGGSGGFETTELLCPEGEAVFGLSIRSGMFVDAIGIRCAYLVANHESPEYEKGSFSRFGSIRTEINESNFLNPDGSVDVGTGVEQITESDIVGGPGGQESNLDCERIYPVSGIRVKSGAWVDAVQLKCSQPHLPVVRDRVMEPAGKPDLRVAIKGLPSVAQHGNDFTYDVEVWNTSGYWLQRPVVVELEGNTNSAPSRINVNLDHRLSAFDQQSQTRRCGNVITTPAGNWKLRCLVKPLDNFGAFGWGHVAFMVRVTVNVDVPGTFEFKAIADPRPNALLDESLGIYRNSFYLRAINSQMNSIAVPWLDFGRLLEINESNNSTTFTMVAQ